MLADNFKDHLLLRQEDISMKKQGTPIHRHVRNSLLENRVHTYCDVYNIETVISDRKTKAQKQSKRWSSLIIVPLNGHSPVKKFGHEQKVNMALLNIQALTNKTFVVNDLINERKLYFIFLTETWLGSDGASLN